jgi:hypothetical protein
MKEQFSVPNQRKGAVDCCGHRRRAAPACGSGDSCFGALP